MVLEILNLPVHPSSSRFLFEFVSFWPFILTVLLYILLFVNLRLLTTHLVSSNYNCIIQIVQLYLEFGIPQFYKRVKYVILQLNKRQIKATVLQLCFLQSRRARTLKYEYPSCISFYDMKADMHYNINNIKLSCNAVYFLIMKKTKACPMKTTNLSYVTDKRYQVVPSLDIELR